MTDNLWKWQPSDARACWGSACPSAIDLFREINHPDDVVWRDRVERYVDLSQLVTHAAIDVFLAENDGILGASGMNNFYLYRAAGSTQHRFFP
jgi:spore coat protein CotH